jgi:hypothetical protein
VFDISSSGSLHHLGQCAVSEIMNSFMDRIGE